MDVLLGKFPVHHEGIAFLMYEVRRRVDRNYGRSIGEIQRADRAVK